MIRIIRKDSPVNVGRNRVLSIFRVLVQYLVKEGIFVENSVLVEFVEGDDSDSDSDGFYSDIFDDICVGGEVMIKF